MQPKATDVAIVDASVLCMDEAGTTAESLAFRDSTLIAVGNRKEVLQAAGPNATVLSAGGATVLPGFIDAHHHVSVSVLYGRAIHLAPPADKSFEARVAWQTDCSSNEA